MNDRAVRPSLRLASSSSPTPLRRTDDIILPILDRLLHALNEETTRISGGDRVDYREFNARKSQCLLELTRVRDTLAAGAGCIYAAARLRETIAAIERNERALSVQLRAAKHLSDVIARALVEGQSDGTYSEHSWRYSEE